MARWLPFVVIPAAALLAIACWLLFRPPPLLRAILREPEYFQGSLVAVGSSGKKRFHPTGNRP